MAKSIIQINRDKCYLCGRPALYNDPLDKHHAFFGPYRKKSEKYGLTVYLHHFSCHIFGGNAVHNNAEVCRNLQSEAQDIAMKHYGWTVGEFRQLFGKNYIMDVDRCVSCGDIIPEGRQVCPICEAFADEIKLKTKKEKPKNEKHKKDLYEPKGNE